MTRFARAKGSKASNEKAPEDGTPWEVMKEQLLQAKKESEESKLRREAENQRITNYENFLKEQKVQKRKATWCDFPEEAPNIQIAAKKKKNKDKGSQGATSSIASEQSNKVNGIQGTVETKVKKKKNKHKGNQEKREATFNTVLEEDQEVHQSDNIEKTKAKKKKHKGNEEKSEGTITISQEQVNEVYQKEETVVTKAKKKKNKHRSKKETSEGAITITQEQVNEVHEKEEAVKKAKKKKNKNKGNQENSEANAPIAEKESNETKDPQKATESPTKKKNKKSRANGEPTRRKPINDRSFKLIINGKDVELVRFDGFPVMKKDAERLQELKTNMINKGIPKSEVQRTIKLERRRAEKALARLKRDVCYNCRKGGHNLSDCPDLKTKIPGVDGPDGLCFKCGSTEHRQFECKVQRDKEFRFASCFICKEQGHIARQCPDNPKGLYPNGGSCKLCGDVTHLKKDCPTTNNKKEETSVKLQTLDSSDQIEDIGVQSKQIFTDAAVKKPKKIKF